MKNLIICLVLALTSCTLNAQSLAPEVVATAGETFSSNSINLEWTLGEIMTESYARTLVLTQGFHQPVENTTSIEDLASKFGTIKVYPNPTSDRIAIETERIGELQLILMDMKGSLVIQKKVSATASELDLSHLPDGIYVLRMSDGKKTALSIRIKKF